MRFDVYGYDKPQDRVQSVDKIIHKPTLQKLIDDLTRNKLKDFVSCYLVEIYHKDKFLGSIRREFSKGRDYDSFNSK